MKIYTKRGDKGETSLLSGQSVSKNYARIDAYGTVDELNTFIGVLGAHELPEKILPVLIQIQTTLFNVGATLATEGKVKFKLPEVSESAVELLETEIDRMESELPPLKNFLLPGGHPQTAQAHVCRTVCRRAERQAVALENTPKMIIQFLNRLSDYFFVLARYISLKTNTEELTWKAD
jgi:cob(I)alamin adenosyltransferase